MKTTYENDRQEQETYEVVNFLTGDVHTTGTYDECMEYLDSHNEPLEIRLSK
jgi:hypothetical protein